MGLRLQIQIPVLSIYGCIDQMKGYKLSANSNIQVKDLMADSSIKESLLPRHETGLLIYFLNSLQIHQVNEEYINTKYDQLAFKDHVC